MNSHLHTALMNSETKESLARMVEHLRAELNRRNEEGRALRALVRALNEKVDCFATRWSGV